MASFINLHAYRFARFSCVPVISKVVVAGLAGVLFLAATWHVAEASTIWSGPAITFTKPASANWNLPVNQDRLTDNVWLTRQNTKALFNIKVETSCNCNSSFGPSPLDTEWASGTTAEIGSLSFSTFGVLHGGVGSGPPSLIGDDLVLHLITDDIYVDLRFLSWGQSFNGGGFSYLRSTPVISPTVISELLIDSPHVPLAIDGNVEFADGSLVAVTPGYTQPSATIESILALTHTGTRTGTIGNEGERLRDGLFVDTITYNASDVTVDILQAAPGDVNGDRKVDSFDIQLILAANTFNNGSGFDWAQGDNNGDGLVNSVDIQNILAANLFGADQYVARPASAATVPEPSSIALLVLGAVVLASRRCRRW